MSRHSTNPWLILVLICMAQFMVILDATVVNVALPSIQKDLGLSEGNLQWIVNAYTLVFGGFLLLGGRAGDLLGRKRLFLFGLVVFTVASLLNGLAQSSGMLIACRGLQGLGAAFISPAALAIITTTFQEGAERAKALGVWAAIAIGGSAFGLIVGGALTELLSWPWIFFINVPVGIAVFRLSLRLVPESKDTTVRAELRRGGSGRGHGRADAARVRHRRGAAARLDVRLHAADVRAGRAAARVLRRDRAALQGAARPALDLPHPLADGREHQHVPGRSGPVRDVLLQHAVHPAGARLRPARGRARVPAVHGRDHGVGRPRVEVRTDLGVRPVAIVGMVVTIAGMLLLTRIAADGTYAVDVLPALVLTALGLGAVFVPLTLIATTGLHNDDQGLASGIFNTSQQIGGALGLAILSSLAVSATAQRDGRVRPGGAREGLPRRVRRWCGVRGRRARAVPGDAAAQGRRGDRGRGGRDRARR